jgi:hypothetical protein
MDCMIEEVAPRMAYDGAKGAGTGVIPRAQVKELWRWHRKQKNYRDGKLPGRNGTLGTDILLRRTIEFSC